MSLLPLVAVLELNTHLVLNCLEGMDDRTATRRVDDRTNNVALIAAHLVGARHFVARHLGADLGSPFGGDLDEVQSIEDVTVFPSLEAIREAWTLASKALLHRLASVEPGELPDMAPVPSPSPDGTFLGWLWFMVDHEAYHVGQLALLRKHFGLPAMRWSA